MGLELRARILTSVRRFFSERDYLEVQTPIMVPSPGLDLHLDAFAVEGGRFLITSPEYQMKRLLADGLERIYQVTPCFRRGERGHRHNPEFTMLEWYAAGMLADEMMDETEALVRSVFAEHAATPLPAFERISVCDAYGRWAGIDRDETLRLAAVDEERFFRLLIERVEPGLAALPSPTFLFDYPSSQASLARRKPDDPELCERFELYVGDVELCNGFGELTDAVEQRSRLDADQEKRRAQNLPVYPIDERFVDAVSRMPDASGNALGIERLVMLCLGSDDIADVMTFTVDTL